VRLKFEGPVILASGSPRRRELLANLIPDFEIVIPNVDEDALTVADPWQTAQKLAKEKALAVAESRPDALVIAGDTVVALPNGEIFEQLSKPADRADGERMLRALSGKTHKVITGVAIRWPGGFEAFTETSDVTFHTLTHAQISDYLDTGEYADKAGAYGIQGMAAVLVKEVRGSIDTVVGLPVERLAESLRQIR
jgi:septum formation protein